MSAIKRPEFPWLVFVFGVMLWLATAVVLFSLVTARLFGGEHTLAMADQPGKPVLLYFTASWCKHCRVTTPRVQQLRLAGYNVKTIDCSGEEEQRQARAIYGVDGYPTFVMFDQSKEVARRVGECTAADLVALYAEARSPRINRTANYPGQVLPAEISGAIVRVYAIDPRPQADGGWGRSCASGTLVASDRQAGLVLTCAHLLSHKPNRFEIEFPDGRKTPAHLLGSDASLDLAALEIEAPGIPAIDVELEPPKQGEELSFYGYGDRSFAGGRGKLIGYETVDGGPKEAYLAISGVNRFGDSGGPIFNTSYRLVGVQMGHGQRSINACHCGHVRNFLARLGWRLRHPLQPPRANPYNPRYEPQLRPIPKRPNAADPFPKPSLSAPVREPQGIERNPGQNTPADGAGENTPTVEPGTITPAPRSDAEGEDPLPTELPGPVIEDTRESEAPRWRPGSKIAGAVKGAVGAVAGRGSQVATTPAGQVAEGWLSAKAIALAAGFGIPGWAAALGLWIAKRRIKKRLAARNESLQVKVRNYEQDARLGTTSQTVAVESDPLLPGPTVLERNRNHLIEVDRAKTDAAWSRACRIIADYYPGKANTVSMIERLKNQILKGEPLEFPTSH